MSTIEDSETGSIVDLIKSDVEEISKNREVFVRVPGYDASGLQIKFRLALPGEVNELNKKIDSQFSKKEDEYVRNLALAMDTIIKFCDGFYVQPAGVEEPVALDPTSAGIPVLFDDRLASVVGLDDGTAAREILRKLFDKNDLKIIMYAEKLTRWQADPTNDVTKELWSLGG